MRDFKKPQNTKNVLSFKKALIWIFVFTSLVSGGAFLSVLYYFHIQEVQLSDHRYRIRYLIQEGEEKGRIQSVYLAEVLNLSNDVEMNIFAYNLNGAQNNLLAQSLIKTARLKKQRPSSIRISYECRKPEFSLGDFQNTGVDREGVLFPLQPFYAPDGLPEVYFGALDVEPVWGGEVPNQKMQLALSIKETILLAEIAREWALSRIDLSNAYDQSLGRREIVVVLTRKNGGDPLFLRMRTSDLEEQLQSFATLSLVGSSPKVIDLRLPDLAFIQSY